MAAFALTIFTGAFLLFQVQPLMGKFILPWFGGGPGVWTTCMLFFQLLLLGGYAYAHASARLFQPRRQVILHLALLAAALLLLPIIPGESWKPAASDNPIPRILLLLAACVGVPYFVLSATGPLVQHWFSLARPGRSPYRLYALSNLGSLLALVSYPILIEPRFVRGFQARLWGFGLIVYAAGCFACGYTLWRLGPGVGQLRLFKGDSLTPRPPITNQVLWILFAACGSALLLATTSKLCLDVAVVPFLWVIPLALYLLSFVVCFDSPRWYHRLPMTVLLIAALIGFCRALFDAHDWSVWIQIAVYCTALFICCLVCHGELYRLRPGASHLTQFYLLISAGGALGGLFAAVLAPLIFTGYYELHWTLFACALLYFIAFSRPSPPNSSETDQRQSEFVEKWLALALPILGFAGLDWWIARKEIPGLPLKASLILPLRVLIWTVLALILCWWILRLWRGTFRWSKLLNRGWLFLGLAALAPVLWRDAHDSDSEIILRSRNFYGVLTVFEHRKNEPDEHHFLLQHGRITHGLQFVDPELARTPTTYYGPNTGVGAAMDSLPKPRHVGLVGLGTGTFASYGRAGDTFRIYEINPAIEKLAHSPFSYLDNNAAKITTVLGDARLSLEREPDQAFDLLVLDAFSSDSIPVHLLTREAFALYTRHLKRNGIMAVHISNHYLDLEPIVHQLAQACGYEDLLVDREEDEEEWWLYSSTWMLLSRDPARLKAPGIQSAKTGTPNGRPGLPLWTDDFTSLYQILRKP